MFLVGGYVFRDQTQAQNNVERSIFSRINMVIFYNTRENNVSLNLVNIHLFLVIKNYHR